MVRRLDGVKMKVPFEVTPLPGYHMVSFGGGEYLVVDDTDSTNNVIVGPDVVAGVLVELATGGLIDEFAMGLGTMWTLDRAY